MSESDVGQAFAIVLLGPGVQKEDMRHTLDVLVHFGIPFQVVDWRDNDLTNLHSCLDSRAGVVVFGTRFPYSDEPLPENNYLPVFKVGIGSPPDSGQLLTDTQFVGMIGVGQDAEINAGLQAARILAGSNEPLRNLLRTKPYPGTPLA